MNSNQIDTHAHTHLKKGKKEKDFEIKDYSQTKQRKRMQQKLDNVMNTKLWQIYVCRGFDENDKRK